MNKSLRNKIIVISVLFVVILALDLVTKYVFDGMFEVNEGVTAIPYLFNIVIVHNMGAAWGIFSGNQVGLIILSLAILIIFIWYFVKEKRKTWLLSIAIAFLVAGCVGNLFDRIVFGYVRDFIQFAFWQSFPVFNFADVFLTFGVILFIIDLIISLCKKPKSEKVQDSATGKIIIEENVDKKEDNKKQNDTENEQDSVKESGENELNERLEKKDNEKDD